MKFKTPKQGLTLCLTLLCLLTVLTSAHAMGTRPSDSPDTVSSPANLRVVERTGTTVALEWDRVPYDWVSSPLSYDAYIAEADGGDGSYSKYAHVDRATSHLFENLKPDTEYILSVRVRSVFPRTVTNEGESFVIFGPKSSWSPAIGFRTLSKARATLESAQVTAGEGDGQANVSVVLDYAPARPARLWLTQRLQSAGESDLVYLKTPVHISAGQSRVMVPVFLTDDALDEGDETFGLDLSVDPISGGQVTLGELTSTTVTITDNDTLEVGIASGDTAAITEGEEASFTLTATNVTGSACGRTSVRLQITHVDGSTEERRVSITPSRQAGSAVTKSLSIYALADQTDGGGVLTVDLLADTGYTVAGGDNANASVAVSPTTLPVVAFAASPLSHRIFEGGAAATDGVVLFGASAEDTFSVEIQTETGSAGSRDMATAPIALSVSESTTTFTLPAITDDHIAENEERFELKLGIAEADEGVLVLGSPARRRVTIVDNDKLEISITPNATSFQELSPEPGMTLHAVTDNTTGLVRPSAFGYQIRFNEGMSPRLGVIGGAALSSWSDEPDSHGQYTASAVIERRGYYAGKLGLSTEPMTYSIEVASSSGYTVAPAPNNRGEITITPDPGIIKVGIERPVYRVRRGAESMRVAVLLTRRPSQRQRLQIRLQEKIETDSRVSDCYLPSNFFQGYHTVAIDVGPGSPLRQEVEIPISFFSETTWDSPLSVTLVPDDWSKHPPQYSLAKIVVED